MYGNFLGTSAEKGTGFMVKNNWYYSEQVLLVPPKGRGRGHSGWTNAQC